VADLRDHLPGLEPERRITDWGRSERVESLVDRTLLEFLYHYWFRVELQRADQIPASGGALLVANRAGVLPFDAAMIVRAVREHRGRAVHVATRQHWSGIPAVGPLLMKLGVVPAHPANLHRLLYDEGELVLVFPEGPAAAQRPMRDRYQLLEFTEPGFLNAAGRAGVPVVPLAVLGGEEAAPLIARVAPRLAVPLLPLPAKFLIRCLEPVSQPARLDETELAQKVRERIQDALYELLARRPSAWWGEQ
jgi:1-acyl-sn-glycerol-3-phosphate acyltransferase